MGPGVNHYAAIQTRAGLLQHGLLRAYCERGRREGGDSRELAPSSQHGGGWHLRRAAGGEEGGPEREEGNSRGWIRRALAARCCSIYKKQYHGGRDARIWRMYMIRLTGSNNFLPIVSSKTGLGAVV